MIKRAKWCSMTELYLTNEVKCAMKKFYFQLL